jgi:hypothetical protein
VEHVDSLLKTGDVEHSMLIGTMRPDLHDTGTYVHHPLEVHRTFAALNEFQLIASV